MVASGNETGNLYEEFVWVSDTWEKIGAAGIDLSTYAPKASPEFTGSISLGRLSNTTVGNYSTALGLSTEASSQGSLATGYLTIASANYAHAEGNSATASG